MNNDRIIINKAKKAKALSALSRHLANNMTYCVSYAFSSVLLCVLDLMDFTLLYKKRLLYVKEIPRPCRVKVASE